MKTKLQHSSVSGLKSIDACQELMSKVIDMCHQRGASDSRVDFQQDIGFSVDVRMHAVEAVSFHQSQSLELEVYIGQRKGLASSTDLRLESIEKMVQAAIDMAKVSAEDPYYGLVDPDKAVDIDLDLYHPWEISPEQAIDQALALEDAARCLDKRIVNTNGASLASYQFASAAMNSRGFKEVHYSTRHSKSLSLLAQQGEEMQTDYAYTTARKSTDLCPMHELAQLAANRVVNKLGSRSLATQELGVVFSNRVSCDLIGHFFAAIQGGQLYRKNSFLCDSLGKSLFPDFVQMQEFPHIPGALASALYDSDGLATRENWIVKNGILQQYILSAYSARRLGLATTANADGVHNLHVSANAQDLDELLSLMGRGFLITELMGRGVNVLTGDYSQGASGFWVENGQIQYPVEGVTVAGNLADIFMNISHIGADHDPNRSSKCGSILVKNMMIAGS